MFLLRNSSAASRDRLDEFGWAGKTIATHYLSNSWARWDLDAPESGYHFTGFSWNLFSYLKGPFTSGQWQCLYNSNGTIDSPTVETALPQSHRKYHCLCYNKWSDHCLCNALAVRQWYFLGIFGTVSFFGQYPHICIIVHYTGNVTV